MAAFAILLLTLMPSLSRAAAILPDGVYKTLNDTLVWEVKGTQRAPFTNAASFIDRGYTWDQIKITDAGALDHFQPAPDLLSYEEIYYPKLTALGIYIFNQGFDTDAPGLAYQQTYNTLATKSQLNGLVIRFDSSRFHCGHGTNNLASGCTTYQAGVIRFIEINVDVGLHSRRDFSWILLREFYHSLGDQNEANATTYANQHLTDPSP